MSKEKRMPKLWEALLTLAILIAALAVGIIIFGVDPHVPMFVGVMAAASWHCISVISGMKLKSP